MATCCQHLMDIWIQCGKNFLTRYNLHEGFRSSLTAQMASPQI
jgi:hypothetical protein